MKLLLAALIPLLGACHSAVDVADVDVRVSTTESVFALPAEGPASISFVVENRGGVTVYLRRCGDRISTALEREEGGTWVQHSADFCLTTYRMSPLGVGPGESLSGVDFVQEPGLYRLRIHVGWLHDGDGGKSIVSDPFIVE